MHNFLILRVVNITQTNKFCQVLTDLFAHSRHCPSHCCWIVLKEIAFCITYSNTNQNSPRSWFYSFHSSFSSQIGLRTRETPLTVVVYHFSVTSIERVLSIHWGDITLSWKATHTAGNVVASLDILVLLNISPVIEYLSSVVMSVLPRKFAPLTLWKNLPPHPKHGV